MWEKSAVFREKRHNNVASIINCGVVDMTKINKGHVRSNQAEEEEEEVAN